ncbi:selenium metabolism-associated LysR family transcriptional regulator [Bacillus sp. B15-48]|uniref:selenium metabolism-associated LysR family transcriptional regulator n=1 Tax=Bacillus sp. B15-48 TaxID=1548601 RepID=UPI00193F808D|nr:selenium metabolism-associated LysR family transcriptional regulator [Bacillus sp. B15-48]MBM4763574.1 LysR family transcriptional regulator [Bacillus sp. B15-48]
MNLEHLKVFYVVANNKSFSQTAKDLHISQSSVSHQIKHLEEQWDCQLFERTTKKITLTPSGEILYKQVKKLISLMNETENELKELKGTVHGDLKIGASLTIGEHILPFLLADFSSIYPKVHFHLKVYNSEQIVEKLHNHEINLGFIESMLSYPNLKQVPFATDELIIIASPQFISKSTITIEELLELPLIIREKGSGTRQVMEDALRKNSVNPSKLNIVMEVEHTEVIKSSVEAGLGISIISKSAVKKEIKLDTLRQLDIEGIKLHRDFYMIYHEAALKLTSSKFIEFIREKYNLKL